MQPFVDDDAEETGECVKALPRQVFRRLSDATANTTPQGMFCDAETMKKKIKDAMLKPKYDVCNFYKKQGMCQLVARTQVFEYMTLSVIALNALWISIDADLNHATTLLNAHPVFQVAEHIFCVYFSFEWVVRFGAFQRKLNGFKDYWFLFDSFMVFMMVSETWVMSIVLLATGNGGGRGGMGDASILRLLRLLRLTRMARMAKLLRSMPELLVLIKGMVSAFKSLVYTLSLLGVLVYVFAIAFRQLTDESDVGALYFSSIFVSMHTLLLHGTLLDSVSNVVRALENENVVFMFIFYLFILLAALTVMNMLIGVLCEVVTAVAATEREQITFGIVNDGFQSIINQGGVDANDDKQISKKEFEGILDNPDATRLLERVEVDVYALIDLADFFFDKDGAGKVGEDGEKYLSFSEFMDIVLSMRGRNQAMVKDIVDLRKYIKGSLKDLEEKLKDHGQARTSLRTSTPGMPMLQKQNTCSIYVSDHRAAESVPRQECPFDEDSQSLQDPAPPHHARQESGSNAASQSREDPAPPHHVRQESQSNAASQSQDDPGHPHDARLAQNEWLAEVAPAPDMLWKKMVRLQGFLSAADREAQGLLESLPRLQRRTSGDCITGLGSGSSVSVCKVYPAPSLNCPEGTGEESPRDAVTSLQSSIPNPRMPSKENNCSRQQETVQEQLRYLSELRAQVTGLGQALAAGVSGLQSVIEVT